MTDRLAEIEGRAEKATDGPWFTVGSPWLPSDLETYVVAGSPDPHIATAICEPIMPDMFSGEDDADLEAQEVAAMGQSDADMAFIAHARDDIPWLCSELRTAQADNARLREALGVIADGEMYVEKADCDGEYHMQWAGDPRHDWIDIARAALKE